MFIEFAGHIYGYFKRYKAVDVKDKKTEEERVRKASNNTDVYCSACEYTNENIENSLYNSGIYADFDDHEDINHARLDAIKFCEVMIQSQIPKGVLQINFTGSKGFSVVVPKECINVDPSKIHNLVVKRIVVNIKKKLKLETIDEAVYDMRRQWRLENSINSKSGLYKIQLTYDELCFMNIEQIKRLAKEPRYIKRLKPESIWSLYKDFQAFKIKVIEDIKTREVQRKILTQRPEKILTGDHPPCIKSYLNGVGEGNRNKVMYLLSCYFRGRGVNKYECEKKITLINNKNNPPLDDEEIINILDSAYDGEKRNVGCNGVGMFTDLLKAKCNMLECSLMNHNKRTLFEVVTWNQM